MSSAGAAPRVSVVIPAYNAAPFVRSSIESALHQSFADLEVVVVDDGSTDDTAGVVSRIDDDRLQLIRQSNQGQSVAINTGVAESRGSYIKLLDADDWINPKHIELQLAALGNRSHQLASCQWGDFVDDCRNPRIKRERTNRNYDEPIEWVIDSLTRDHGMMGGWMWLTPRQLWEKAGGYAPELSFCPNNDFEFSIRLLLASEGVRFADGAVYSYRKGFAESLSGRSGRAAMESVFLATDMGTRRLLDEENSPRIRQVSADRFQKRLFQLYPEFPDLAEKAERRIAELGGSRLELRGGLMFSMLEPLVGWKAVRRLQTFAYRHGWSRILRIKAGRRVRAYRSHSGKTR